jgi:hypothetical protein
LVDDEGLAEPSNLSGMIRHFPDTEVVGRDLPSLGGSAAMKFDRSRLVDSQNGKMLGPAG